MTIKNKSPMFRGSKVAVLGPSRSGKSKLVQTLGNVTPPAFPDPSTEGFDRVLLPYRKFDPEDPDQPIELHQIILWDFVGYDTFRAIHEAFLDDVDLVMITWAHDTSNRDESVRYWLDVLRKIEKRNSNATFPNFWF